MKNLIILLIFAILTTACEKSTLKITYPNDNFFLGKLKSLGSDFTVGSGGQTITIKNTDGSETNYTFEKTISGLGGIYKDKDGKYMVVVPAGDKAHTVKDITPEQKQTLDEIIDIIGEENSGGLMGALTTTEGFDDKNVSNLKAGLSEEKQNQLQSIIDNNFKNGTNLGAYKEYTK